MVIDGSKESSPSALGPDNETMGQGPKQRSVALDHRAPSSRNDTPVQIPESELYSFNLLVEFTEARGGAPIR